MSIKPYIYFQIISNLNIFVLLISNGSMALISILKNFLSRETVAFQTCLDPSGLSVLTDGAIDSIVFSSKDGSISTHLLPLLYGFSRGD